MFGIRCALVSAGIVACVLSGCKKEEAPADQVGAGGTGATATAPTARGDASAAAAQAEARADLTTPKAAALTFWKAVESGDAPLAQAAMGGGEAGDRLAAQMVRAWAANDRLLKAAATKFAGQNLDVLRVANLVDWSSSLANPTETPEPDGVLLQGPQGKRLKVKQEAGKWRVVPNSIPLHDTPDLGHDFYVMIERGHARLAEEVGAGKHASVEALSEAMNNIK